MWLRTHKGTLVNTDLVDVFMVKNFGGLHSIGASVPPHANETMVTIFEGTKEECESELAIIYFKLDGVRTLDFLKKVAPPKVSVQSEDKAWQQTHGLNDKGEVENHQPSIVG